jgi:hypothetical protein
MPSSHWPVALPLALILLALAIAAAFTAVRGRAGSLRRDGRLGVRSEAATRSDIAFRLANRVAWPIVGGAAGISGVCALLILAAPLQIPTALVIFALAVAGSSMLLIKAGQLGDRAAQTVPRPAAKPGGASCGGCGCGAGGCAVLKRDAPADTAAN